MIEEKLRTGNFTSSQMYRLCGTPSVMNTYIDEKRAERALNRSIDTGHDGQSVVWGRIMEAYLFSQEKYFPTGSGYSLCNKTTIVHPKYSFLSGSPDIEGKEDIGEIKCFYPKNYYLLSSALISVKEGKNTIEYLKKEHKEVFWQVLSNAIIRGKKKATIFAYIPTKEELEDCILMLAETNFGEKLGLDPWMYRFMIEAQEKNQLYRLPYIDPEKTDFPNFVKFTFDVTKEDKEFLTQRVLAAQEILTK